jgi:hypothetical protein
LRGPTVFTAKCIASAAASTSAVGFKRLREAPGPASASASSKRAQIVKNFSIKAFNKKAFDFPEKFNPNLKDLADKAEAEAKAKAAAEAKARADAAAKAKAANHQAAASAKAGGILEYVASSSSASISALAPASVTQKRLREGGDRGSIPAPAHAPAAQARAPVPDPVPGPAPAPVSDSAPAPSSYAGRATWFTAKFLPKKKNQPSATVSTVKNRPTVDPAPDNELASILAKRPADALPIDPEAKLKQRRMVQNVVRAAWNTKTKDWNSKFRPTLQILAQVLSETKASIGIPTFFRCCHAGHADTYGEATPALIAHMMQQYSLLVSEETEKKSTFVDLGSGHGGLVCQMASFRKFHVCFGIEYEDERASWAYSLANDFFERLQRRSYGYSNIQINFGDFFKCDTTLSFLKQASLVWVNNVKFADINSQLLILLDKSVPIGCVVVSFVSFLTRQTYRNETGFQAVSEILVKGAADWTGTPQKVYVMQKKK